MTELFQCTASLLSNFYNWKTGDMFLTDSEEDKPDVQVFVERMDRPATSQMDVGTAFHKLLETSSVGAHIGIIDSMGFTFDFTQLEATLQFPQIVEQRYFRKRDGVVVSGQVDAIMGDGTIVDWKTCAAIDPEKYTRSYQWRVYLWLTGLSKFRFDVFKILPPTQKEPNIYRVTEHLPLECHRYAAMDQDVELLIDDFNHTMATCAPMREAVQRAAARRALENA